MKKLIVLATLISLCGCAEGGDGESGAGGLPEGSSVTCGDFEVDASNPASEGEDESESVDVSVEGDDLGLGNPAVSAGVARTIDYIESLGGEAVEVKYSKGKVIVVGCGGTIITNETNVTNDVSGSGAQN